MNKNITIREISMASKDISTAKYMSEIILMSKDPELNYYAVLHLLINKKDHLQIIINSGNPLYNFKCIKHCIKTNSLTIEEKKYFINKHSEIILNSNNKKLIKELIKFFKYNKIEGKQTRIGNNKKRCKKNRI